MPSAERVKDFNVVISGKQKRSATVGAPWNGIFLMPEKRNKLTQLSHINVVLSSRPTNDSNICNKSQLLGEGTW